jgi:hypothetical protein
MKPFREFFMPTPLFYNPFSHAVPEGLKGDWRHIRQHEVLQRGVQFSS